MNRKLAGIVVLVFFIAVSIFLLQRPKQKVELVEAKSTLENIIVSAKAKGFFKGEINIENKSKQDFNYGGYWKFEHFTGDKWISIEPFDYGVNDILYIIEPGKSKKEKIDIGGLYGNRTLPVGKYRVSNTGNLGNENVTFSVEFELKFR